MAGKEQLTPDEVEMAVLSQIPKLSATDLEAACGAVSLAVLEAAKGNKKALRKQLTNYLDTDEEDNLFNNNYSSHDKPQKV